MKIKSGGHTREVSQYMYDRKFKNLGYEIIEEAPKTKDIEDYTKKEIIDILEKKELEFDPRARKDELFELMEVTL